MEPGGPFEVLSLLQAQEPCYWFEKERSCTRWVIMAACAGVTAALDLSVSMFLVLSGSSVARSDMSERYRRCVSFQLESRFLTVHEVRVLTTPTPLQEAMLLPGTSMALPQTSL